MWTELAAVPVSYYSSLVTLRGCVLAIGGTDDLFDVTTNSWSVRGEMPTRSDVLAAVLPSNDLVVVGGALSRITEIGSCL